MADQGGEGLLSSWLRKLCFKAALPYLQGHVLDFGCGTGGLAVFVVPSYYGTEIDFLLGPTNLLFFKRNCRSRFIFVADNVSA